MTMATAYAERAPLIPELSGWEDFNHARLAARGLFPPALKHLGKLLLRPHYRSLYREYHRLRQLPAQNPNQTWLFGRPWEILDGRTFLAQLDEIFIRQLYRFPRQNSVPRIIDGGANIGTSVLFFKKLYPESSVTAFEADPKIFKVLSQSLSHKGCRA